MKKSQLFGYVILGFSLFILVSIPPKKLHRFRASCTLKSTEFGFSLKPFKDKKIQRLKNKISILKEENAALKLLNTQGLSTLKPSSENLVANVIFRDPAFWSSSIMIDKGSSNSFGNVQKNSTVLSNGNLIGIVEEPFDTFSKVRLLTDKNLNISVKKATSLTSEGSSELEIGTISGSQSVEFRYRFKEVSGIFFSKNLKAGDILITSGLDGVFPEGLPVAKVEHIDVSEEEVAHHFKAKVTAQDIKYLKHVTILPPLF